MSVNNSARTTSILGPGEDVKVLAERCLSGNAYLALRNVSCEFRNGVLELRGYLPKYYLKQLAQEVVAHIDGVDHVDNRIQVVTPPWRSDYSTK